MKTSCSNLRQFVAVSLVLSLQCGLGWAQPRVQEIQTGGALKGPIEHVTIDASGGVWVATPRQLYQIAHGEPRLVDLGGGPGTRIALAPGGDRYLRLIGGRAPFGLFDAEIVGTDDPAHIRGRLRLPDPPYGFSDVHVGREGSLFVTTTPLDDAEGVRGAFLYVFWSRDGIDLGRIKLDGPRMGTIDERGESILLYGEQGAVAVRGNGSQIWSLPQSYRKGVIAAAGKIALLNPAMQTDVVHVVRNGNVAIAKFGAPVHDLAITPDGKLAAIATDKGHVAMLRPQSCDPAACTTTPLRQLPVASNHYISDLEFLNARTLAIAVFEANGVAPHQTFTNGFAFIVSIDDRIVLREPIALPQPPTWSPLLGVTYSGRSFAAFTRDSAIVVPVRY